MEYLKHSIKNWFKIQNGLDKPDAMISSVPCTHSKERAMHQSELHPQHPNRNLRRHALCVFLSGVLIYATASSTPAIAEVSGSKRHTTVSSTGSTSTKTSIIQYSDNCKMEICEVTSSDENGTTRILTNRKTYSGDTECFNGVCKIHRTSADGTSQEVFQGTYSSEDGMNEAVKRLEIDRAEHKAFEAHHAELAELCRDAHQRLLSDVLKKSRACDAEKSSNSQGTACETLQSSVRDYNNEFAEKYEDVRLKEPYPTEAMTREHMDVVQKLVDHHDTKAIEREDAYANATTKQEDLKDTDLEDTAATSPKPDDDTKTASGEDSTPARRVETRQRPATRSHRYARTASSSSNSDGNTVALVGGAMVVGGVTGYYLGKKRGRDKYKDTKRPKRKKRRGRKSRTTSASVQGIAHANGL
jgi:hypothetical protein